MYPKNNSHSITRFTPSTPKHHAKSAHRRKPDVIVLRALAVVALSVVTASAANAQAEAHSKGKRTTWPVAHRKANGTTGQVFAFSEANGIVNQTLEESNSFGRPLPITPTGRPHHAGPPPHTVIHGAHTTGRYNLGEFDFLSMSSRTVNGADAFGTGMVTRLADRWFSSPKTIDASAEVIGRSGFAFGAAADPMYFSPGPLTVLDGLDELDLIVVGDGSHAGYQMTMSSNIPEYEMLYDLSILLDAGELPEVYFESNPLLGLDDALIVGTVLDSLTAVTGGYELASPVGLEFSLDSSSPFEIDFLSNAWGMTVPAPGAISLLAMAAAFAAPVRRRLR